LAELQARSAKLEPQIRTLRSVRENNKLLKEKNDLLVEKKSQLLNARDLLVKANN
jgi:hypothetical protein